MNASCLLFYIQESRPRREQHQDRAAQKNTVFLAFFLFFGDHDYWLFIFLFIFRHVHTGLCMGVSVCACIWAQVGSALRGQKRVWYPLEMELKVIVS